MRLKEYPKYDIKEDGSIWSDYKKGYLKPDIRLGYPRVKLKRRNVHVGKLVLKVFKKGKPSKLVSYIDGNPLNCNLSNLRWK